MSNFKGDYLRVLTPQTTDGVNLKYGHNNQPVYKETHLPLSARKQMEKKNEKRSLHLKHIIDIVRTEIPPPVESDEPKAKSKTK